MNCYQQLRTIWILTLLLAGFLTAHAQDEVPHFFRLTYNNGLSDNKVNCIIKSHEGYIWAGTPQGLNRYDGFRIRVFYANPRAPHTLPDNNILNLILRQNKSTETLTNGCISTMSAGIC